MQALTACRSDSTFSSVPENPHLVSWLAAVEVLTDETLRLFIK